MARMTSKTVEEFVTDVNAWLAPEAQDESTPAYTLLLGSGFSWPLIPTASGILREVPWWQYWNARRGKSLPEVFGARPDAGQPHHPELKDFERELWAKIATLKDSGVVLKDELPDLGGPNALALAYTAVMEGRGGLYFPELRRRFLRAVIGRVGRQINEAHLFLAAILQMQDAHEPEMHALWGHRRAFCRTIFTTNFDPLLQRSLQLVGKLYLVSDRPEVLEAPDDDSEAINLVYTHGSSLRYRQLNTRAELELAMKRNAGALKQYFERHGVIVIGYSGWADTTMQALASCEEFNGQLYWVDIHEPGVAEQALAPHVVEFLAARPDNRFYVPAKADGLLGALHRALGLGPTPRCFADPIGFRLEQLRAVSIPHAAPATVVATNAGAALASNDASTNGTVAGEVGPERTQAGTSQQSFLQTILERLESAKAFFDRPEKHNEAIVRDAVAAKFMTELTHAALESDVARVESLARVMLELPDLDPRKRAAAVFGRGMARMTRGEHQPAVDDLTEVIDRAVLPLETLTFARMHRGLAFDALQSFDRALADFSAVVDAPEATGATRAQALLARGARRMAGGAASDAMLDFTAAFELADADAATRARASYNLGVARMQLGEASQAATDFTAAIDIQGAEPEIRALALNNRGIQRLNGGERAAAREDFERVLALEGATAQARALARNNHGLMALNDGRYDDALVDLDALLEAPDVPASTKLLAHTNRSFAYAQRGRYAEAVKEAGTVIESADVAADTLAGAHINRGRGRLGEEQPQDALADFDAALAMSAASAELRVKARYNRAQANRVLGRTADAIADLEAVAAAPEGAALQVTALHERAGILIGAQRWSEAVADLSKLLELAGANRAQSLSVRLVRANSYAALGDRDAALRDCNAVIEASDASTSMKAVALHQRALVRESDDPAGAREDYGAVVALSDAPGLNRAAAFYRRGRLALSAGENELALVDFTAALETPGATDDVRAAALEERAKHYDAQGDVVHENEDRKSLLALPGTSPEQRATAHIALGVNHARASEPDLARANFEVVVDAVEAPAQLKAQAWYSLGVLHGDEPDGLASAVDAYTHAILTEGVTLERKAKSLVNRAQARAALEQFDMSLADSNAVLALADAPLEQRIRALRNRVDVHSQRKDWRAASEDCTAILALASDEPTRIDALIVRAWSAYENGDLAGLIDDSRAALELDATQENSLFNLALGLALRSDAEAFAHYERACASAASREVIEASLRDFEDAHSKRGPIARADEIAAVIHARLAQPTD